MTYPYLQTVDSLQQIVFTPVGTIDVIGEYRRDPDAKASPA